MLRLEQRCLKEFSCVKETLVFPRNWKEIFKCIRVKYNNVKKRDMDKIKALEKRILGSFEMQFYWKLMRSKSTGR